VRRRLAAAIGRRDAAAWLDTAGLARLGDTLTITAPSAFAADWLETRLGGTLARAALAGPDPPARLRFAVSAPVGHRALAGKVPP
jgi:chromosomal replication initiation ATPase DnaA